MPHVCLPQASPALRAASSFSTKPRRFALGRWHQRWMCCAPSWRSTDRRWSISTATQPAWRRSPALVTGFPEIREIVPDEVRAFLSVCGESTFVLARRPRTGSLCAARRRDCTRARRARGCALTQGRQGTLRGGRQQMRRENDHPPLRADVRGASLSRPRRGARRQERQQASPYGRHSVG